MNVFDYLLDGKPSSSTALLTLKRQHTYGELRADALDVARLLTRADGRKGQRALLLADSGMFWAAAYLGIIRAGLVCVPLPPRIAAEELDYIRSATEPAFIFVEAKYSMVLEGQLAGVPIVCDEPSPHLPAATCLSNLRTARATTTDDSTADLPDVAMDDLAALMFTSGSTGRPRGVMVSNRNIVANTDSIVEYLGLTTNDRIMAVLPFHYCFGASLLHTHLRVGGSVVIDPRFMYPERVLQRMQETECTGFAGVPSHYQILLRKSAIAKMSFPHLRYVQQAGGQLQPHSSRNCGRPSPASRCLSCMGRPKPLPACPICRLSIWTRGSARLAKESRELPFRFLTNRGSASCPGKQGR